MGNRNGTELAELTMLSAVAALSDELGDDSVASSRVLSRVEEAIGMGPRYSYPLLLDLAARWKINLPLISILGERGDRGEFAPPPDYNMTSLTEIGKVIAEVEERRSAPVVVRLINGTMYRGGTRPPLDPFRVIAALRQLLLDIQMPDREIYEIIGPPSFANPCKVTGDFDALYEGSKVVIRQAGRIARASFPVAAADEQDLRAPRDQVASVKDVTDPMKSKADLVVESLPDDTGIENFLRILERHSGVFMMSPRTAPRAWKGRLPLAEFANMSTGDDVRIEITLSPGSDAEDTAQRIAALNGISAELSAEFPAPLGDMLRDWITQSTPQEASRSLHAVEDAIARDRQT